MAQIIKSGKPLSIQPIKSGQPLGAILASMGLEKCMPLVHGAQGCSSFAKVFFIQHFHEPIPLQSTAMEPITTIMGANNNVIEALATLCEKHHPKILTLLSTGLSELQGTDLNLALKQFAQAYPQYNSVKIISANTPDFYGSLENGYSALIESIIQQCLPQNPVIGIRKKRINVLLSHMLTPGDHEMVIRYIEAFGLQPIMLPDLADSMDGHLGDHDYTPVTQGGTPLKLIEQMGQSCSTIVIGTSLQRAASLLEARCGLPCLRLPHLMTLTQIDALILHLKQVSGREVPTWINRQRLQVLDAMIDTHMWLQGRKMAIAAEGDLLVAWLAFAKSVGLEPNCVVASVNQASLTSLPTHQVMIGDLEDVDNMLAEHPADLLLANSHAAELAEKYHIPLLRIGFPLFDQYGVFRVPRQGYAGMRDTLFEIANAMQKAHQQTVYHSPLKQQFNLSIVNYAEAPL